jgi:hypothetical protein
MTERIKAEFSLRRAEIAPMPRPPGRVANGVEGSTDLEDEFSSKMARLAQAMRIGSLGQAIELDVRQE